MIVADTNLIAYLLLRGDETETAERVLDQDPLWIAPVLWRSEFRNVLAVYLGRGLLELEEALHYFELSQALLQGREFTVPSEPILRLAEASKCSAYDCEFVALARQKEVPLVTSDRGVLKAFPSTAVHPREFLV